MNSPKQRFREDPANIKAHQALIEHPSFERSIDTALLQMTHRLRASADPNEFFRLQGASEFIQELANLHVEPTKTQFTISQNLPTNQ